jgi:uncharacterized radical SAM superfamily protein
MTSTDGSIAPSQRDRHALEALKINCLATGVAISSSTLKELGGINALTVHEYPTTGGVTLRLEHDVFINAPFDEWFCRDAEVRLSGSASEGFHLAFDDNTFDVSVVPLPGYIGQLDDDGHRVDDVVMSHVDRARLSPISGCAYDCAFCDLAGQRYQRHSLDRLIAALRVAETDRQLPVNHVLISGGSPGRKHHQWFVDTCRALIAATGLPVDVMMSAQPGSDATIAQLAEAGVHGVSLNLELLGDDASTQYITQKHRFARPHLAGSITAAVNALGSGGRVRSLVIIGLEPIAATIEGVTFLAALGCDPVLSPFRPAAGTALVGHPPPSPEQLHDVLNAARAVVRDHGVSLGPRCVACQHNTLSFPWDVEPWTAR